MKDLEHTAITEAVRAAQAAFVEDVIDQAAATIETDYADIDAVRDATMELREAGYNCTDTDKPTPIGFAGNDVSLELLATARNYHRVSRDRLPDSSDESLRVDAITFHDDASLPDDTVLLIHPDAIIPESPGRAVAPLARLGPREQFRVRPWLIRDPRGVVVIKSSGEGGETA